MITKSQCIRSVSTKHDHTSSDKPIIAYSKQRVLETKRRKIDLINGPKVEFVEPEEGGLFVIAELDEAAEIAFQDSDEDEEETIEEERLKADKKNKKEKKKKKRKALKLFKRLACDKNMGCNASQLNDMELLKAVEVQVDANAEQENQEDEPEPPEEPELVKDSADNSGEGGRELLSGSSFETYFCRTYGKIPDWCGCYTDRTAYTNSEIYNFQ